jgi:hypothetical protein
MTVHPLVRIVPLAAVLLAAPVLAANFTPTGFEVGVRTGYAFAAGDTGAPANETDKPVGDYVSGQWPIWFDAGYQIIPHLYVGGYFQYGFGFVNDDRQDPCRNANVDCSASDVRVGGMLRYHFAPTWPLSPWAAYGFGYEWGSFSVHQSAIGNSDTDSDWSGFEFMNLQVGADYALPHGLMIAPFLSFSLGQFRHLSETTRTGNLTFKNEPDLEKHSLHEWILIGVRFAFRFRP